MATVNKASLIKLIVQRFENNPIVFTTGYASRLAYDLRPRARNHFYMLGSMGMASAIARGVASRQAATGRFPVVVDGDGALLMGVHCLLLEEEANNSAILHVVANDATYASTGGQAVPASSSRICALASAAGYAYTSKTDDIDSVTTALNEAEEHVLCGNSALIDCQVMSGPAPSARVHLSLPRLAQQFAAYCEETAAFPPASSTRKTQAREQRT